MYDYNVTFVCHEMCFIITMSMPYGGRLAWDANGITARVYRLAR